MKGGVLAAGTTPVQAALIALIIAAKFVVPLLIVRFPFAAGWANFVLDGIDGDLLVPLGLPNEVYQPVDKVSDWVTYVAIVIVGYRNAWPTRRLMLGLFLFRSIGQLGFLLTGNELFLAAVPELPRAAVPGDGDDPRLAASRPAPPRLAGAGVRDPAPTPLADRDADRDLQAPGRVLHARRQHRPQRLPPAAARRLAPGPQRVERRPHVAPATP